MIRTRLEAGRQLDPDRVAVDDLDDRADERCRRRRDRGRGRGRDGVGATDGDGDDRGRRGRVGRGGRFGGDSDILGGAAATRDDNDDGASREQADLLA